MPENFIVHMIDTFVSILFLREESFDYNSRLSIYKTILVICNTPHQTHCVRNYIFPPFVMVIAQLWAQLVVCVLLKAPDLFLPSRRNHTKSHLAHLPTTYSTSFL